LDIEDGIGRVALGVDDLALPILLDGPARAYLREELPQTKALRLFPCHLGLRLA
jgi:hypothetical protein